MTPSEHPLARRPYAHLARALPAASRRASSWDRAGGNRDYLRIEPGETATLLETDGSGCVTHLYCGMVLPELTDYRDGILRCYWDGAAEPAVEVPLGDFFGLVHGRARVFASLMLAVNPGFGSSHGLNAYFPMPFDEGARITLENRGPAVLGGAIGAYWYHVDYELYDRPLETGTLRFHARFAQELRTDPVGPNANVTHHPGVNLDGRENYVVLDTEGRGRMAGLLLEVDNVAGGWYGEGDDMVFVDGEEWPPSIHGTGTEEVFGGGACPSREYAGPYSGFHLIESPSYEGLVGMYRWYIHDPIGFERALRWTIEHGHANNYGIGYASVAYWYQEPQAVPWSPLPAAEELRPSFGDGYEQARELLFTNAHRAREERRFDEFRRLTQAGEPFYEGLWAEAIASLEGALARPA